PSFNLGDGLARVDTMPDDLRILTTHAGSLPRPAPLTELFVRRAQGQAIDAAALAEAGRAAVAWVVGKQREGGLDVISSGEQQRESFVLYLRRRLSGIGGEGERAAFADIEAYPQFKAERARLMAHKPAVSNVAFLPKCVGPISYIGGAELGLECATLAAAT